MIPKSVVAAGASLPLKYDGGREEAESTKGMWIIVSWEWAGAFAPMCIGSLIVLLLLLYYYYYYIIVYY